MPRKPASGRSLAGLRHADPERFQHERERILLPSWQPACHVSDLPGPGTAVRVDFLGRSAFVLRGDDGTFRAFLNACRHRGTRLIEGDPHTALAYCVDSKLRCPYHAWVYDQTGALIDVPGEDRYPGLEPAKLALHPLPLATALGFIFVAFAPPARPLADMLAPVVDRLGPQRFEVLRRVVEPRMRPYRADWKVLCEHHLDRHRLACMPSVAAAVGDFAPRPAATNDALCFSSAIAADDTQPWSARAYARWVPRAGATPPGEPAIWTRCYLWPNVVLDAHPDQVRLAQVLPLGSDACAVRESVYAQPDGARDMRIARYLNARVRRRTAGEDLRLVERRQAGLATGGGAAGPLAVDEYGLRWFEDRVTAALRLPFGRG
jgi:phenylpropionate dioxygenase-like ring-hydroxylating dioxygenase large terminal subunit